MLPMDTDEAWDVAERLASEEGCSSATRRARRGGRACASPSGWPGGQAGRDRDAVPRSRRALLRGAARPTQSEQASSECVSAPTRRYRRGARRDLRARARELPERVCGIVVGPRAARSPTSAVACENIQNELHAEDPVAHPRDARTAYNLGAKDLFKLPKSLRGDAPADHLSLARRRAATPTSATTIRPPRDGGRAALPGRVRRRRRPGGRRARRRAVRLGRRGRAATSRSAATPQPRPGLSRRLENPTASPLPPPPPPPPLPSPPPCLPPPPPPPSPPPPSSLSPCKLRREVGSRFHAAGYRRMTPGAGPPPPSSLFRSLSPSPPTPSSPPSLPPLPPPSLPPPPLPPPPSPPPLPPSSLPLPSLPSPPSPSPPPPLSPPPSPSPTQYPPSSAPPHRKNRNPPPSAAGSRFPIGAALRATFAKGYGAPSCAPTCWPAWSSASSRCRCRWRSPSPSASRRSTASTPPSSPARVVALLGGCKFQVTGPTAAFVVILAPIVDQARARRAAHRRAAWPACCSSHGRRRAWAASSSTSPTRSRPASPPASPRSSRRCRSRTSSACKPARCPSTTSTSSARSGHARGTRRSWRARGRRVHVRAAARRCRASSRKIPAPLIAHRRRRGRRRCSRQLVPGFDVATIGTRFHTTVDGVDVAGIPPLSAAPALPWGDDAARLRPDPRAAARRRSPSPCWARSSRCCPRSSPTA